MADSKITVLSTASEIDPDGDALVIVDVSDTSMSSSGTTKRSSFRRMIESVSTVYGRGLLAVADARQARSNLRIIDSSLAAEILRTAGGDWSAADLSGRTIANRGVMGSAWDAYLGTSPVTPGSADPTVPVFGGSRSVKLPGLAGNYVSAPYRAGLVTVNDFEIVVLFTGATFSTGTEQALYSLMPASGNRCLSLRLSNSTARPTLYGSSDGTSNVGAIAYANIPYAAGVAWVLKVTRRASDGRVQYFTAPMPADGFSEPGAWTQLGTDRTGLVGTLYATTGGAEIGALFGGTTLPGQPGIARVIHRDGINGTTVADFDARLCGPVGYTDQYGNAWTVNRSATGLKTMLVDEDPPLLFGTDDRLTVPAKLFGGQRWTYLSLRQAWGRPAGAGNVVSGRTAVTDGAALATSSANDLLTASVDVAGVAKTATVATPATGVLTAVGMICDGSTLSACSGSTIGTATALGGAITTQASTETLLGSADDAERHRDIWLPRALSAYEWGRVLQHLGVA